METTIAKAKEFVRDAFVNADKAHDYYHAIRVYNNAKTIIEESEEFTEIVNAEIVLLSALLHDLNDTKVFSNDIMLDIWFKNEPSEYENDIRKVISEVSFSKGIKATTIESMIVQDADRLDAIGAVGIARVFTYGGAIGRPIYSDVEPTSMEHFNQKLFKIKDKMNTKSGKRIAEERNRFMQDFVTEFWREVGGED